MPYILAVVIVAVAVVLGIFTGVWGGLVWLVVAGIVLLGVFLARARETKVDAAMPEPTGATRTPPSPAQGTANQRVGQS
jgi:hypothetical protein